MTDQKQDTATTRRRARQGEAPPPERNPQDDDTGLSMEEGEVSGKGGPYFSKAPGKDLWHAFDRADNPAGTVKKVGEEWTARAMVMTGGGNALSIPAKRVFGSAAGARSWLEGFLEGYEVDRPHPASGLAAADPAEPIQEASAEA